MACQGSLEGSSTALQTLSLGLLCWGRLGAGLGWALPCTCMVPVSQEKQKLLDEIEGLTLRLSEEQESKRKMGDRLSHERHQFQRDKEATQEVRRATVPSPSCPVTYGMLPRHGFQLLTGAPGCLTADRGPAQAAGAPAAPEAGG